MFHDVFLKVRALGTGIYSNLERSLSCTVECAEDRPSTKTARTPTVKSCLGKNKRERERERNIRKSLISMLSGQIILYPRVTQYRSAELLIIMDLDEK